VTVPSTTKNPTRTIKLRNHHLTIRIWPDEGRILEVQSLRTGRHLVSWWPFKAGVPERAGGIGERTVPPGASPYSCRELPDRVSLTRELPNGLTLKKSIYLPPESLVFHVSIALTNSSSGSQAFLLDQVAAICPGFGGPSPEPDSGILHCRHKAFLKRLGGRPDEIPYEIFERVHVERDDLEWAAFNDPVGDHLVCALLPEGHAVLETEYHWWLQWSRSLSLAPGESFTADFHYACTPSVDLPVLASQHFIAGFAGETVPLGPSTTPRVRIFGLDTAASGNVASVSVNGKSILDGKPLPEDREPFDVALPEWPPERDLAIEVSVADKFGAAEFSARRCREISGSLEAVCREALALADAGAVSNAKAAAVLAQKRIVDINREKCAEHLEPVLTMALKDASAILKSPLDAVPLYNDADLRWQAGAAHAIDVAEARSRLLQALSRPYDLSAPRFRAPHPELGAFALADSLLETALLLAVHPDAELLHLFKSRLADLTVLWARFGEVVYETIHHGVMLTSVIPAYAIASRQGWLTRADEVEVQAMILDLAAKIRRRGGIQFRLSNWWAMEAAPLAYLGALFPYLPEAPEYLAMGREAFYWLLVHGTLADGGFWEMSPSYHFLTLEFLMRILEALLRAGQDLYASGMCGRHLADMVAFIKAIAVPPGRVPAFDDSGRSLPPESLLFLAKRLHDGELLHHADAAFALAGRPKGSLELFIPVDSPAPAAPDRGSEVIEPSGKLILRSSCRSIMLVLDFGPHGGWHGHNDKLSFELFWRDLCLVPDAGSYKYEDALHWSWFKAAAAHNTVTIADENQLPACGSLAYLLEKSGVVTAAVSAPTYPGVIHRREITLGDRTLLVDDFIENAPPGRTLVWRMNSFAPIVLEDNVASVSRQGVRFSVTSMTENTLLSVAHVPLMPEASPHGGEYVQGWQLRIQKTVTNPSERFLVRFDFDW
jgi:hypothetical protein